MKTQHTPGPWKVHRQNDSQWPLVMAGGPAGRIVCNVNPESCPDAASAPAFVQMPADANARLIAAAPELLEVCKALVKLAEDVEFYAIALGPRNTAIVENAKAAIQKAQ